MFMIASIRPGEILTRWAAAPGASSDAAAVPAIRRHRALGRMPPPYRGQVVDRATVGERRAARMAG